MMRSSALLTLGLIALASTASARPARCYVAVDGFVAIDGQCDYDPFGDGTGSFQVMSPDGDWFAQVEVQSRGLANGYWNGTPRSRHTQVPLGRLARNDACWSNESATVCAW